MKETSGRTKNNYRAALATLFSFARQKGHLPRGQQTEAEFSTRYNGKGGEIGTYTPKQLQILLSRIEPRMIPFIAIGAFAGLRSAEIARLEWQEVRFDQDVIELKAARASQPPATSDSPGFESLVKSHAERVREGASGGPRRIRSRHPIQKAVDAITDQDGEPLVKIVHNGLRHSF